MSAHTSCMMKWKKEGFENPLVSNQELFESALDEFSGKSFNDASLNDILKRVSMNKGSFYYRFQDKLDLYLSLVHRIGMDKMTFFQQQSNLGSYPSDFFGRIAFMTEVALRYARSEVRHYAFWKRFRIEEAWIQKTVKETFKDLSDSAFDALVLEAIEGGQFDCRFSDDFLLLLVRYLLGNLDQLLGSDMDDDAIRGRVDEVVLFMKRGLQRMDV